jgi:hypothetical protein
MGRFDEKFVDEIKVSHIPRWGFEEGALVEVPRTNELLRIAWVDRDALTLGVTEYKPPLLHRLFRWLRFRVAYG